MNRGTWQTTVYGVARVGHDLVTALLAVQWLRIHLAMQAATGLVPGQGTKIPHAVEQLSQSTGTTEPESQD